MSNRLAKICDDKLEHVKRCKASVPVVELLEEIKQSTLPRGFHQALKKKIASQQTALIAEVKKASPSKGLIREDFDPATIAQAYEVAGATCLSVLTDIPYFQGADEYLQAARASVKLPILRKDFMLDPYQIIEARALGADCILLIMAALTDTQAQELESAALELGMDVLIEAHDAQECERGMKLQSRLMGINNRNLKTLQVDLQTSKDLTPALLEEGYTVICESGIATVEDVQAMQAIGVYGFLVGESLMRQPDIAAATRALLVA